MTPLLSTAFLPPISYMALLVQKGNAILEGEENFEKQSYRNRCVIYGPNGLQNLTIPVQHGGGKTKIKDLKISYEENWPVMHWRSLISAYKGRPFFDILAEDIRAILESRPSYLLDLNLKLTVMILDWLQADVSVSFSDSFQIPSDTENDFRYLIHPKKASIIKEQELYFQHFSPQHGFLKDLSVIDLIFSEGRASWDYLNEAKLIV